MSSVTHPLRAPLMPDADSTPFWKACAEGRLVGQRCGKCGLWRWPPREHCARCHAAAPEWIELCGAGTVAGAVVLHRAFDPGFAADVPLAIVHVEMDGTDGQMVLIGNLVPPVAADEATGARVAIGFRTINGDAIPLFTVTGKPDVT